LKGAGVAPYSMVDISYHLHPITNEYSTTFHAKKLFHEFNVAIWLATKQTQLHWVKMN
jgi:hypothetical protein